jgi:DnaD/phage-associated family protein
MVNGWISVHRKIMDSAVWQDPDLLRLWMYCLMKATHKEKEQVVGKQIVQLKPGEFVTGRFSLSDDYNKDLPKSKKVPSPTLWRWMKKLETLGNLNINSSNKYSVVSIVNYELYQRELTRNEQQNEQQVNNRRSTDEQQMITNNKDNNLHNIQQYTRGRAQTEEPSENPFTMYEKYFGILPSGIIEDINYYHDVGLEPKLIAYAIYKTAKNGQKFNYARGILNNWHDKKIFSFESAQQEEERFKNQKKKIGGDDVEISSGGFKEQYSKYSFKPSNV